MHEYGTQSPAHAILGGYVYRGVAIPDLRGAYSHADYMRVELWSFRRSGSGITQLTNRTAELAPPPPHVLVGPTGFGEDGYGELYVCDHGGKVFRIAPGSPVQTGVVPYGAGTPGCSGAHTLGAQGSPVVGNPAFVLRCTHAPPSFVGLTVLADAADVAGSDPTGLGFVAHVQATAPFLVLQTMWSDAAGVGTFAFGIPPAPALAGVVLHGQALWLWPPAICTPSPFGWSSSPGLTVTLQP